MEKTTSGKSNRLAQEKSPYLLQHKDNPVDWYPWGEAAWEKAVSEDKPIFLSIGYSTCHWCHVMERESFEDPAVAEILSANFVSVKLDREERPDIDKIYMTAVQSAFGQGGWPLNVFLTSDFKPFYGGTYFPPQSRYGRPSFKELLTRIATLWKDQREELIEGAEHLTGQLKSALEIEPDRGQALTLKTIHEAAQRFKAEYDPQHGGFGAAPKFPRPTHPAFLIRYAWRFQDEEAGRMVLQTCKKMAQGGIYDQIGGGFCRYSVDAEWKVPHFEKMLYDNAQLAHLYLDAWQYSGGRKEYARTVDGVLEYLLRDMTHPDGGWYSAEDADSEGKEGKFYCWTLKELREALSPEDLDLATRYYELSEGGNFLDHSDPQPLPNQNMPQARPGALTGEEMDQIEMIRQQLFEMRKERVRPGLDDKILTSWNGLALGAMARAGWAFENPAYVAAAEANYQFIKRELWNESESRLYHRWREGERDNAQLLDDYAFLTEGVLWLYQATLDSEYLRFAIQLTNVSLKEFYDEELGGFRQSGQDTPNLLFQVKEDYDGAEPSGNAVAVRNLIRLSRLTGDPAYREAADKTLALFAAKMNSLPQAVPYLLQGLWDALDAGSTVFLSGARVDEKVKKLHKAGSRIFHPNLLWLTGEGDVDEFYRNLNVDQEVVQAFLCHGSSCESPISSITELTKTISQRPDVTD